MRILHTSDWHVGRTIKGRSRDDEHRAVLAELVAVAREEQVDLVIVAGDVFDHGAPSPSSEEIVYEALLELSRDGTHVAVVAGNHDNGRRFTAVRAFLALARVHALGEITAPDKGGCIDITVRSGETARIARLPWVSQRGIVRATELMAMDTAGQQQEYMSSVKWLIGKLCAGFGDDTVNLLAGHLTIAGSVQGGGERQSETIFEYFVPAQFLPQGAHYCALGHIHRQQRVPGSTGQAWYSGSPMQLDFGEKPGTQGVLVFDAKPGQPVKEVRPVALTAGRPLVTEQGTLIEVLDRAGAIDPRAYVRVILDEEQQAGLADQVYRAIPNAVKVELAPRAQPGPASGPAMNGARSPHELYADFLEHQGVSNTEPLLALFDEILEEVAGAPA